MPWRSAGGINSNHVIVLRSGMPFATLRRLMQGYGSSPSLRRCPGRGSSFRRCSFAGPGFFLKNEAHRPNSPERRASVLARAQRPWAWACSGYFGLDALKSGVAGGQKSEVPVDVAAALTCRAPRRQRSGSSRFVREMRFADVPRSPAAPEQSPWRAYHSSLCWVQFLSSSDTRAARLSFCEA